MKCRHCGVEIERCPSEDRYVSSRGNLAEPVGEAWVGGGVLACIDGQGSVKHPIRWHEPLIDIEEILADLRAIEADLR